MFFRFPPDARWNPDRNTVEFGIGVGEYEGVVRVSRRVFQILLSGTPTPEHCLESYHLHRTRLELIAERKGTAYLDGELCGVRPDGTTSFSMIQAASDSGNADTLVFFLFDLRAMR
jgi:hypothetical protein